MPITLFCAFTREWAVDPWLECLGKVQHDPALVNLVFIIDCANPYILHKLKNWVEPRNYRSFQYRVNDDHEPNEVRIAARRQRIAFVKNQSKGMVAQTDGEFVISLEDDTVFDNLVSFNVLIAPMLEDKAIGFVEGVQCGRWGNKMVGAWNIYGKDHVGAFEAKTLLPDEGLELITGGGWYGYATPRSLYINCDYWSASTEPWGPDVNYGIWLYQVGHQSYINWDIVFGHRDGERILYPDSSVTQIVYNKDINTGAWTITSDGSKS